MNAFGQTICLNMIVKDEEPVIGRCLSSVRPLIDHWVIVDTGSSDDTREIIREVLKDLPGELHERPWQDFAHNRSEALAFARGHGDYVLVIDADEVLEISPDFQLPRLTCDSYNIQIRYGGCAYLRRQLVRNALTWRYEGVLHEYITCEQARTEDFLPGLQTVPHHDGARSRNQTTYRRDAQVLEKALLDDPLNTRYVFYLAQSYRDAGDLELALRHYKRRSEMGGWREEVWYSHYQISQIKERMGHDWPEVLESYLTAWQFQPDRAGPLYRIAMHYQAKREYALAHLFFSRAMKLSRPESNRLFVEHTIYDYQLPLEYAVACFYVGDHAEAIETNNRLLTSGLLPAHAVDQVVRNRRFSLDVLFPKQSVPSQVQLVVLVPFLDPGPGLDDSVHCLLQQDDGAFKAVFVDCGSTTDHSMKVPLSDPRFTLVRMPKADGWQGGAASYMRDQALADEVILVLPPDRRFGGKDSLRHVRSMFEDSSCTLAYGQFRSASGALGSAEPAADERRFNERAADLTAGSAIAFRARLLDQVDDAQDWNKLFRAAGFAHTRFSDDLWTIESPPS